MKTARNIVAHSCRNNLFTWLKTITVTALAAMSLAANVHAQPDAQQIPARIPGTEEEPAKAWRETNTWWYSMKFNGGPITTLRKVWTESFTNDNFVITESAADVHLPAFEIRHVRLSELARSMVFLSEGALTVEIVDALADLSAPGSTSAPPVNIWRIGTPSAAEASLVKMRAVPAPNLFKKIEPLLIAATEIENDRLKCISVFADVTRSRIPRELKTRVIPLPDQKVVVLIGTENGIAGLESFIQASERSAAEAAPRFNSAK